MSQEQFKSALQKLVNDTAYRQAVQNDPQKITKDFQLSGGELGLLMTVGQTCAGTIQAGAGAAAASCSSSVACCCCCPSDRRLKSDIEQVALLPSGIRLYRFKYLWSPVEYVGVMAQEIRETAPHAVSEGPDGFLRVDYEALGLRMLPYSVWSAQQNQKQVALAA